MSAGVPDEICIFMRTFIGSIGSVAPTRRVPYSHLEISAIHVLLRGASLAKGRVLSWHG
jgi:hypothetical protein